MIPLLTAAAFWNEALELLQQLEQPAYAETVLRPVFVWGVGFGTLLLIAAHLWQDARMKIVALIAVAAAAFAIIPYLKFRSRAATANDGRAVPAAEITRLRQDTRWVFVSLGGLATATIFLGNKGRIGTGLTWAAMAGGLAAMGFALWLDARDAGVLPAARRSESLTGESSVGSSGRSSGRPVAGSAENSLAPVTSPPYLLFV